MRSAPIVWSFVFLLGAAGIGYAWTTGLISIPDRWNPWTPLHLDDAQGGLVAWKLDRLENDPQACRDFLATTQFRAEQLDDKETGPGCGFSNAVLISGIAETASEPFSLSCRTAASLAIWEKHVLQPAARRHFDSPVRSIEHFGSYACRGLYGRESARRSQHATADALDFAGVTLADGTRITVAKDWEGTDAASLFLRDLHEGGCRYFDAVLGPQYNAAHHDHFHLDRGRARICR